MAIYAISIVIGYITAPHGRAQVLPMKNFPLYPIMLIIVAISTAGCAGTSPFHSNPTIVPTLTVTPGPSTAVAPPTIPPINSLATGTQIVWGLQGGYGRLIVQNRVTGQDAVVILAPVDDPKRAVLAVYVKGQHEWTVDGITDGQYVLYDMIGTNWDGSANQFQHTIEYARFDSTLNYYTTDTESRSYTVTLSGVGSGDALSTAVSAGDVPPLV